jgi:hypothetical protein
MEALYPTKKALKESVGKRLKYKENSMFGAQYKSNGTITVAAADCLSNYCDL